MALDLNSAKTQRIPHCYPSKVPETPLSAVVSELAINLVRAAVQTFDPSLGYQSYHCAKWMPYLNFHYLCRCNLLVRCAQIAPLKDHYRFFPLPILPPKDCYRGSELGMHSLRCPSEAT